MYRNRRIIILVLVLVVLSVIFQHYGLRNITDKIRGRKTVRDRLEQYGPSARGILRIAFDKEGVQYPPNRLVFAGFKKERLLEVYASSGNDQLRLVKTYPILRASGRLGPKLAEGDMQVPEGIYKVVFLNANSLYHLSLRLNYPNEFDREMAKKEGRENLGGNIMIHGSNVSIGCLAMGDPAIEELFVLAADTGISNIKVILSPCDLRKTRFDSRNTLPSWTSELYKQISGELDHLSN
jgi:hypothetical protein